MNTNNVAARFPSMISALTENAAALIAQISVVLLGFMDLYFMAKQGVEVLATVSYVAGFVILVNASSYGALQAFLIVGGDCLGRGDRVGFHAASRAAVRVGTLLNGGAHLLALSLIGVFALLSLSVPYGAFALAILLTPSILLNAMCLVFRLKAMLLKASGVLIVLSLVLVCAKFFALSTAFHIQPFVKLPPLIALALSCCTAALLCLLVSYLLDSWRFYQINQHRSDNRTVVLLMKKILTIGLPIGAVIVLEMSVLGGGQLIQTLIGTRYGVAFGLVIQFILMAETVAVALGQVATINVSMALAMHHRGALSQAVIIGISSTMLIHGLIATAMLVFPAIFVDLILPKHLSGDLTLLNTLTDYLRYGAICQFLLAMVVCLASILRGMDDLKQPLMAIAINYVGLGVVCAAAIAYLTVLRDLGVWIGITASLLSSVTFLSMRVMHHIKRPELQ